jgi:hypothetical protein
MGKDATRVTVGTPQILTWPRFCVLCLNAATTDDSSVTGGGFVVPYCDRCYDKVRRLQSWQNGILVAAFIIGVIGAVIGLVAAIVDPDVTVNPATLLCGWVVWFALTYPLLWLALLPFRLIFRSKLANPGVKVRKSKEPGATVFKFLNPEYADMFRRANGLPVPGQEG